MALRIEIGQYYAASSPSMRSTRAPSSSARSRRSSPSSASQAPHSSPPRRPSRLSSSRHARTGRPRARLRAAARGLPRGALGLQPVLRPERRRPRVARSAGDNHGRRPLGDPVHRALCPRARARLAHPAHHHAHAARGRL